MIKKLLALLLAILLPVASAHAAITRSVHNTGVGADDFTFDVTVDATANAFLIVACGLEDNSFTLTVTYNGVAMNEIRSQNHLTSQNATIIFGLVAPSTGTNTVALNIAVADDISCIGIPYYGVDQATPTANATGGEFSAVTDSGAVSITCSSPNFAFVAISTASDANFTAAGEISKITEYDPGLNSVAIAEDATPDGSVTAQWTMAANETGTQNGFCINAASDVAPVTSPIWFR